MPRIGGEGNRNATLAIVGEKPGRDEVAQNRPFVGPSGRELSDLLTRNGVDRNQVYITNAVKNVENFSNPTHDEIRKEQLSLYRELEKLPNLTCIVPMGGVALSSLSNFHFTDPLKRRGSILKSFIGKKMVSTLHPSFYMRGEWRYKPIVRFDIARALEETLSNKYTLPERTFHINPTFPEVVAWTKHLLDQPFISFDIELFRNRGISCLAFSCDDKEAFCIPFSHNDRSHYWDEPAAEVAIWRMVQQILDQKKTLYVTQNGLFDCWHLWRHGVETPYMAKGLDTLYMHRLRAPDLPHDLGFLTSIYTREPYYKDESGKWDSGIPVPDKQFWIYNCKDAAVTLEIANELSKELESHQLLDYYRAEMQPQWDVLLDMQKKGIRVDLETLRSMRTRLSLELTIKEELLKRELGWLPNTRSFVDMGKFYNQLGIRPSTTPTGRPKSDEESLQMYASRHPKARETLENILEINERRTIQSGFLNLVTDRNGFYHASYSLSKAKTGRLASEGDEAGGPQLQNIPKPTRTIFIPDSPSHEFTGGDLARAEAMVVAWDAQDNILMEAFLTGKDVHRVRAAIIYRNWNESGLPPDDLLASIKIVCDKCRAEGEKDCKHSERQVAKQSGHAFAYKMGVRKYCMLRRQDGIFVNEAEATRIKDRCVSPAIRRWHDRVYRDLTRRPWLSNPFGRRREFYGLLDEEMHRAALSWIAQSTVGSVTSRAMIELYRDFEKNYPETTRPRIVTQTHDSLLINHLRSDRAQVSHSMTLAFNQPMTIHGEQLLIPLELQYGNSWGTLK